MTGKILIVEDDPKNIRMIEMVLKSKGYELLKATSGEEALDTASRERPDLIIMDIRLPKMSGLEVTRILRANPAFTRTPIIGITTYAMRGDKEKVIEAGCNLYLSKPINTRALPGIITLMLSQQQEVNL